MKYSASAITGITSLLIDGKATHSTLCLKSPLSAYADEFCQIEMFLIDEASMLSLDALHDIDQMLRDVIGIDVPFCSKIMVFGGDFRQTLPIVRRAWNTMIVENCIISSSPWPLFQHFKLTNHLRATPNSYHFSTFLLRVGDGDLPLKQDQSLFDCHKIPEALTLWRPYYQQILSSTKFKLTKPP